MYNICAHTNMQVKSKWLFVLMWLGCVREKIILKKSLISIANQALIEYTC